MLELSGELTASQGISSKPQSDALAVAERVFHRENLRLDGNWRRRSTEQMRKSGMDVRIIDRQPFGQGGGVQFLVSGNKGDGAGACCGPLAT
jgi:hypothetical protein